MMKQISFVLLFIATLFLFGCEKTTIEKDTTTLVTTTEEPASTTTKESDSTTVITKSKEDIIKEFLEGVIVETEVQENIELKSSYEFEGEVISCLWESLDQNVLTNDGVITRKEYDQKVILKLTASIGDVSLKKAYTITVILDNTEEILEKIAMSLIIPPVYDSSLKLPTSKKSSGFEVEITWTSSHPEIISTTGELTKPAADTDVELKALLSLNGRTKEVIFMTKVEMDPSLSPSELWYQAETYTGKIDGEIMPTTLKQFNGAVYRKCVSSKDYWLGIEVVVTLPEPTFDEKRQGVNPYQSTCMRYLDNPSLYLGGNSSSESDVGLSWSIGASFDGKTVNYERSIAFRPFWRYIDGGKNLFANAAWQDTWAYYYPGDTVRMSCYSPKPGLLQLRIELLEETTIPEYKARREAYNLGEDYPKVFLSPLFPSSGMGKYKSEFKRVVALDQANNEGKATQKTNTKSENAIFHEVYLYRKIDGVVYKVPMTEERYAYCNAPQEFAGAIIVSYEGVDKEKGGEVVTLDPHNNN